MKTLILLLVLCASAFAEKIAADSTSKVIRIVFTHEEPAVAGEYQRTISAQEFAAIDAIHRAGNTAVDDAGGIRAATVDEADERKTFRAAILGRISGVANVNTRSGLYAPTAAILLALENRDKDGAKAIIDTLTNLPLATRTKLKALVDRIQF